jgi:hypothetical protein
MSTPTTPEDLLDLRLLPAWVNEPVRPSDYAHFEGEDSPIFEERKGRRSPPRGRERDRRDRPSREPRLPESREKHSRRPQSKRPGAGRRDEKQHGRERGPDNREKRPAPAPRIDVTVRFIPHLPALNSVIAQIKSGSLAYSVFALARLFLEKPERYDVQLTTTAERPLFQLGEAGAVAADPTILEGGAFVSSLEEFYKVEVTQHEPLKGNFTNVARCRLSGTLLGPTNHHNYQPQLRTLYETRFSRRMSFRDYQSQIEIVSEPAVVEEWKEQARNVTTYTTMAEPAVTFGNLAETERHFRKNHLPGLVRSAQELTVNGVLSRRLSDRALGRTIEEAWASEIRSPTKMMQELTTRLRQAGLNIFRHRRGMLFVSPIRPRVFSHESAGVSPSINAILEKVTATPGINRKQLAEQLTAGGESADLERAKLTLAADLHWLVSAGYIIEFNDTSLDLPRAKQAAAPATEENSAMAAEAKPTESITEPQATEGATNEPVADPVPVEKAQEPINIET